MQNSDTTLWATKTTILGKGGILTHFNSQEDPDPIIFCHSILTPQDSIFLYVISDRLLK